MSTTLKFVKGGDSLQFEKGSSYPSSRPLEKLQVRDRTAAGTFVGETVGVSGIETVRLVFAAMSKTDHDALKTWFDVTANGSENSFTFTDEYGNGGTVKIISDSFDFREIAFEIYEGELLLEYV